MLIDNLIKDFLCKLLHKKHSVFIPQLLEIVSPVGDLRCFPLAYRSVGSSTRTYKDCINRDRNSLLRARQWRTLAWLIDNLIKDFLCKLLHKKHSVFIPQLLEIVSPVGDLRCFPLAYRSVGSSTRTYKDCINRDRNSLLRARQWRTLA